MSWCLTQSLCRPYSSLQRFWRCAYLRDAWDHDHFPSSTSSAAKSSVSALASWLPPCIPSVHRLCCGEVDLWHPQASAIFRLTNLLSFFIVRFRRAGVAGYLYLAAIAFILTYLVGRGRIFASSTCYRLAGGEGEDTTCCMPNIFGYLLVSWW